MAFTKKDMKRASKLHNKFTAKLKPKQLKQFDKLIDYHSASETDYWLTQFTKLEEALKESTAANAALEVQIKTLKQHVTDTMVKELAELEELRSRFKSFQHN